MLSKRSGLGPENARCIANVARAGRAGIVLAAVLALGADAFRADQILISIQYIPTRLRDTGFYTRRSDRKVLRNFAAVIVVGCEAAAPLMGLCPPTRLDRAQCRLASGT